MNLQLHRARRVLASEGIAGVEELIERRRDPGALRLGVLALAVVPALEPVRPDTLV